MFFKNKKDSSILRFLVISFASFFAVFMLFISIFSFYQVRRQNDDLFDYQMKMVSQVVETIIQRYTSDISSNRHGHFVLNEIYKELVDLQDTDESVGFTVYNPRTKKIILRTSNLPKFNRKDINIISSEGYEWAHTTDNGRPNNWYTYTLKTSGGNYITVFADNTTKEKISRKLIAEFLMLLASVYVMLIAFTYYTLRTALRPIDEINEKVAEINPHKNIKLHHDHIPYEIQPIVMQINSLIEKFHNTLEREKRFSGDAAHELKTPIAGLKTHVEIAMGSDDIDEIKTKLKIIMNSTDRYSHIIDQLLTLTRIQPDEQVRFAKQVNVNIIIETFLADNALRAIEKDIELSFHPSSYPLCCLSNDYFLGILFKNLITNAIKYTKSGGAVEVFTYKEGSNIIAKVKDNGIGVPPENIDRIFDRFYRETGTGEEGSGLGLAIVTEIIRLHNGEIAAKNNIDQPGLTITVKIPLEINSDL